MRFRGFVYEPMYEYNGKMYLRITLDAQAVAFVERWHQGKRKYIKYHNMEDPLEGHVLRIKIPFRYNRVMAENATDKPIQSLGKGDQVDVEATFSFWNLYTGNSGFTWTAVKFF